MNPQIPDSLVTALNALQFDISLLIGAFVVFLILAIAWKLIQKLIIGSVEGMLEFWGSNLDEDDIVYIKGTRRARVARTGMLKTVFYMYDTNSKMVVQNTKLESLGIEKKLSTNGGGKSIT